jgi:hypothetical protein
MGNTISFSELNGESVNQKPPVKRFTLSYFEADENRRFDLFHTQRSVSFVRVTLFLAITLYITFSWLDPLITNGVTAELMAIRLVSCLIFGTAVGLTFTKWGYRNFQFLMSSVVLIAGISLVGMILIAESAGGMGYYAGILLAIMYAHSLMRIRFIYSSLTTWFVILLYGAAVILLGSTPTEIFISNLFFLIAANIMGMFASYWLEYYMKAVYWKEKLLREKTDELQKEHQRKTDELADAREMQLKMLPYNLPGCDIYNFSFSMTAASEVGGDYYDYHLDDKQILTFGIGDATGHGLKAGIMVTAMKLIFAEHAGNENLVRFLKRASNSIGLMGFRKLYMAFAIGRLSGKDTLELAGAGMPPALIYRAETGTVEQIPLKGMPLGSSVSYPYHITRTTVEPGDIVMLMTDGLAETFNPDKKMFGYERIERILTEMHDETPDRIIERFHLESEQWLNGKPQTDDMTFFIFKRSPVLKKKKGSKPGKKLITPVEA